MDKVKELFSPSELREVLRRIYRLDVDRGELRDGLDAKGAGVLEVEVGEGGGDMRSWYGLEKGNATAWVRKGACADAIATRTDVLMFSLGFYEDGNVSP